MTAPIAFAGAVAAQILQRRGIYTAAHILSIKDVNDRPFDNSNITKEDLIALHKASFPVQDPAAAELMREVIEQARNNADSVGGVIEVCTVGFPAGVGSPIFDGLENALASIIFGIPAVKGLSFGAGFDATQMYGSENNDLFYLNQDGTVKTRTNHHGGILGGISSGMPIDLKVAFKPTPSIGQPQQTINFRKMKETVLTVQGRHDPCVVPRAVPVVEAAVNLALLGQLVKANKL